MLCCVTPLACSGTDLRPTQIKMIHDSIVPETENRENVLRFQVGCSQQTILGDICAEARCEDTIRITKGNLLLMPSLFKAKTQRGWKMKNLHEKLTTARQSHVKFLAWARDTPT